MEVNSLGISAEYGNNQGAVLNIVTKQGGNEFRYDASYHFQTDGLTSHPITLPCDSCTVEESAYHRAEYHDFTAHVGGPILRDRLWFFTGLQYFLDADTPPGADPAFPSEFQQTSIFWKINWQISPRWKLLHSFHHGFINLPETPSVAFPFETTSLTEAQETAATYAILTHIVSDNTFWEVRASGLRTPDHTSPQNGDPTLPFHFDYASGVATSGGYFLSKADLIRDTVQGSSAITPRISSAGITTSSSVSSSTTASIGTGMPIRAVCTTTIMRESPILPSSASPERPGANSRPWAFSPRTS